MDTKYEKISKFQKDEIVKKHFVERMVCGFRLVELIKTASLWCLAR